MDDSKETIFFKLLKEINTKIEDATKKIENAIIKLTNENVDETTVQEILNLVQEILDLAVSLYRKHLAIFEYLFLKYDVSFNIDVKIKSYEDIKNKISEYSVFYITLSNSINLLNTLYESIPELNPKLKDFIVVGNVFLKTLYRSYTNLVQQNNNIYNIVIDSNKLKKEISEFKHLTIENFKITEDNLQVYNIKINERINKNYELIINVSGGRKNPTKQKPKGKHYDMTMKDIKDLCKANQIKLSRVVEGKRIAYKKKELITKLKRKKLL